MTATSTERSTESPTESSTESLDTNASDEAVEIDEGSGQITITPSQYSSPYGCDA